MEQGPCRPHLRPCSPRPSSTDWRWRCGASCSSLAVAHRVGEHETAFGHRDAAFVHNIVAVDPDPARMPGHFAWMRAYWDALRPLSLGGSYVNFLMDEGEERVRATYGENYPRLREIKAAYDPENLFRVNQNIAPQA